MNAQKIDTNIIELPCLLLQYSMIVNHFHSHATYSCSRQRISLTSSSIVFFITLINTDGFDFKSLIIAYARTPRILYYHTGCKLSHGIFERYDYMMTIIAYYICSLYLSSSHSTLFIFYYSVYYTDIAFS
jgi:hypothetical protein